MNGAPDLDQEHESFRQSVRSFLDNHLTDGLRRAQRMAPTVVLEPEIYRTWHRILFEKGWVAPHWPQEFGGPGWSVAQRYIFEQECAAADAPLLPTIGLRMVGPLIMRFGDDAQKAHYLPRILSGEDIWCQGFSEPGAGSDLAALTTKATRSSTGYTVNGVKLWTTYGHHANRMIALVRTATTTRKQGFGFRTAMKVLDRGRIHVAAVCVGQARRILHEAVTYAMNRKQFGQPIAEFQLIQAMLADSQADLYASECMVRETARRHAAGHRVSREASCCKMFASEMVGRIADRAVQIHGGAGYMRDSAVERFYRDVRLFRIYEGTTQIQQLIIARDMIREALSGENITLGSSGGV